MATQTIDWPRYRVPEEPERFIPPANLPGTGGTASNRYLRERGETGYAITWIKVNKPLAPHQIQSLSVRDIVTRIRERINLSISEFASLCGVSRQAVYKWLSDDPPALEPENSRKLENLDAAREVLERADVVATPWILDRRIVNGKTFFENQRDGYPAAEWAEKLVTVLEEESRARKRMDVQLGDRLKKADEIVEWGIPMLSESID